MQLQLLLLLALWLPLATSGQSMPFSFSVMMHTLQEQGDDSSLRAALDAAQSLEPAFIIVNGIKAANEECSDKLYRQRKALLETAAVPVFLSMAGSDWINCRDRHGKSSATVWLNTLREQLYGDISWTGVKHMIITRQSANTVYRSYAENTRWQYGGMLFATINLPAYNNRYLNDAGRNNEFEDRQIANRDWLRRVFAVAKRDRNATIVLICDGNPLPAPHAGSKRDGYAEIRQQLVSLSAKFAGRVLVIQGPAEGRSELIWHDKLGYVNVPAGQASIAADISLPALFTLDSEESH
jgi:hypothetical protein